MTTAELATHLRSLAAVLEAPSDEAIDVIDLAGDVRYLIATWEREQHVGEAVKVSGDSNRESVVQNTEAESEIPVDAGAVTVAEQRSSAIPRPQIGLHQVWSSGAVDILAAVKALPLSPTLTRRVTLGQDGRQFEVVEQSIAIDGHSLWASKDGRLFSPLDDLMISWCEVNAGLIATRLPLPLQ